MQDTMNNYKVARDPPDVHFVIICNKITIRYFYQKLFNYFTLSSSLYVLFIIIIFIRVCVFIVYIFIYYE